MIPSIQRSVFQMLDPFFKFVFLDPKCNEQHAKLREHLTTSLLRVIHHTGDKVVKCQGFTYMIQTLSNMQVGKLTWNVESVKMGMIN